MKNLQLGVNDVPKWGDTLLFGLQQALISTPGFLVYPILLSDVVCAGAATVALRVQLIAATFVACGLATFVQTVLGIRLPILQGPSIAFLPPLLVYKSRITCNYREDEQVDPQEWTGLLNEIAGSLLAACVCFILIGATGLAGMLSKLIGPITITPLMILLSISIMPTVEEKLSIHWVSLLMLLSVSVMAVYLEETTVRLPGNIGRTRLFGQFPYLLSILWVWLFCHFLTVTNLEPKGSPIRTDRNRTLKSISGSEWFSLPYPGMFGMPRFNWGLFMGYVASSLVAVVENLGNYGLLARVARQKPPPRDAVSRGILVEGMGSLLSASMGIGTALTTDSQNIALIHFTRVASRRTMEVAGMILFFLGVFTKCAALLASIPEALVGGMLTMGTVMIAGVSLSNLQLVDLNQTRNLSIIGLSLMLGLVVPRHVERNPIQTGNPDWDGIFNMLLSIKMFVGGVVAVFLDNTVPGATPIQRGILPVPTADPDDDYDEDAYNFKGLIARWLQNFSWLPFLPSKEPKMGSSSRSSMNLEQLV